ncbi:MAG TPA: hypothetical protein VFD04_03445 [Actinomycetes bacterium]|jgi:hypothetical protein|nr:hypothetical protein [Actinomycetes bacterium]
MRQQDRGTEDAVRALLLEASDDAPQVNAPQLHGLLLHGVRRRVRRRRLLVPSLAAVAATAAVLAVASPIGGPGVASAAAAVRKAAAVTAASGERSGTAVVRITHENRAWAGATIRWHDRDLSVTQDAPSRPGKVGSRLLVVGGTMYGVDPERGGWVQLGSPKSIDPGSGTTPDEYLAAVRGDVSGATLRRISMTGLTTSRLADGSTAYSGSVVAGLIARETGFKEGQAIRVLPFGYVAHDEAANPDAPLRAAVTVGPDGLIRELTVTWGSSASAWRYTVTYSRLGKTPAPVAPAHAPSLRDRLRARRQAPSGSH